MKIKIKKQFFHPAGVLLSLFLLLAASACKDEIVAPSGNGAGEVPEGYIRLTAAVGLEGLTAVQTRAVDPDAKGVESIRLYCFDKNGLFITTVSTDFTKGEPESDGDILKGSFHAYVPDYTHTVHIVANQSTDAFRDTDYLGQSEKNVMTGLVASSSVMIYWGRVEAGMSIPNAGTPDPDETLDKTFDRIMTRKEPDDCIHLVRNQARVQFSEINKNEEGVPYFTKEGFYVCNTNAFGTIAPYNEATGTFDWVTCGDDSLRNYVTLPSNPARASLPDDVYDYENQYVFETENPLSDPVSVLVKGYNSNETAAKSRYYRILIQDADYNTLLIRRNHSYDIHITGHLSPGYDTPAEALAGTPVNNVYFTVSDEITSLTGSEYVLSVENTRFVLTNDSEAWKENDTFSFGYTFAKKDNASDSDTPEKTDISVSWVGSQNVASSFTHEQEMNGADKIDGTVTLNLIPLGDGEEYREGTLMIHAKRLIRRVKVITVKKQSFVPAWVSSYVWPHNAGEAFTLLFSIPDDTPPELFPFDVMVTAPEMDVRSETGMRLDVVTAVSDPARYGEDIYYNGQSAEAGDKPIGYKFVVPVTAPGRQRIYFRTTLPDQTADYVTIENPYFETMRLPFTFSRETENRSIVFTGMENYKGPNADHEDYEGINYIVVPRKKNAVVSFGFTVVNHSEGDKEIPLSADDEFVLFTTYLDRNESGIAEDNKHFNFTSTARYSNTSGRFWGFWPKDNETEGEHEYHTVHMRTNRPNCENVVVLRTNSRNAPSIKQEGNCQGNNYRSASFELRNYSAFRFNATVKPQEIEDGGAKQQAWTYEPGQQVDIEFDVTSFMSESEYGLASKEVDPFGTEFKVYIDAPMIEIDKARCGSIPGDKFYEESPGRFVYVVNASRDKEISESSAWSKETRYWTTETYPGSGTNPLERKKLPFITNSISSAGSITISADPEFVDFIPETWTVTDKPITGQILYADSETAPGSVIPAGAFVSFERTRDNTRIGSLTIGEEGRFRLNLRTEYTYAWGEREYIAFYYTDGEGNEYALPSSSQITLKELFDDYYKTGTPVKLVKVKP